MNRHARQHPHIPDSPVSTRQILLCLGLLASLPCMASVKGLYFLDLQVTPQSDSLRVEAKPVMLVRYDQITNPHYSFPEHFDQRFDAPLQQLRNLLQELDRKREGLIKRHRSKPFQITTLRFFLTTRERSGATINRWKYDVDIALLPTPGMVRLKSDDYEVDLNIAENQGDEGYRHFLNSLVFPAGGFFMNTPKSREFFIDLYFTCHDLQDDLRERLTLKHTNAVATLATLQAYQTQKHLGTTHCSQKVGGWSFVTSGHLHLYRKALAKYADILLKRERGEPFLNELEDYLATAPTDYKAVRVLLDGYVAAGEADMAYSYVQKRRLLYAGSEDIMSLFNSLHEKQQAKRLNLLNKRDAFRRDANVQINITSPKPNDYIGGEAKVTFAMQGHNSPILQIDCLAGKRVVGSITQAPFEIPFTVPLDKKRIRLKVAAYFENGTFQETEIPVKTLFIGAEEQVQLVSLRMVASRPDQGFMMHLDRDDVVLMEDRQKRPITKFQKDIAPLRVAILIDTSSSMIGDKLYRAQDAVNAFLSKLEPSDRACIYTFDHTVLRLNAFTNQYDHIQPILLTLSPRHSTALNDALAVAHQDLQDEEGTQVIIVVSDGRDSASGIKTSQIYNMLRPSKVLVYSVIIDTASYNDEGIAFMQTIAKLTGSNYMAAGQAGQMEQSFNQIYRELKSSYLIDFYSRQPAFDREKLRIRFKDSTIRARFTRR